MCYRFWQLAADDQLHLKDLIESNKKLEIICISKLDTSGVLALFTNKTLKSSFESSKHIKMLKIHEIEINNSVYDALRHVPGHIVLELSGNKFTDQSGCKALIQKAAHQEALVMQDCIMVNTEIADAISQLPEQANLDLSGNTVTKMDSSFLCHVIPVISNRKIDLSGLGVVIDSKVAEVIYELTDEADVDISDNTITQMDIHLFSKLLYRLNNDSIVTDSNADSRTETSLAEALYSKTDNTHIDISCNDIYKQDVILSLLFTVQHWKQSKSEEENKQQNQNLHDFVQVSTQTMFELHNSNTYRMNPVMITLISSHDGMTCLVGTLTINKQFTQPLMVQALIVV